MSAVKQGFDAWLKANWPKGIAEDCTKLDKDDTDCIERGSGHPCPSCETYMIACSKFDPHWLFISFRHPEALERRAARPKQARSTKRVN